MYFFKDPQGRTLLAGSAHTLPGAHLQLAIEIVGHDRTDHVALIGRASAAGNIAECSLAFEFGEYVLLLSATFQETYRLSDGAAFVGNHAFIVVLKILRFEQIQLESSIDLPGINRAHEQEACLAGPRLGFPLFLKRAAWPLASDARPS